LRRKYILVAAVFAGAAPHRERQRPDPRHGDFHPAGLAGPERIDLEPDQRLVDEPQCVVLQLQHGELDFVSAVGAGFGIRDGRVGSSVARTTTKILPQLETEARQDVAQLRVARGSLGHRVAPWSQEHG